MIAPPPPVPPVAITSAESAPTSAPETSWTCDVKRADGSQATLIGSFPAISAELQRNGGQYRIQATIPGHSGEEFAGTHPAAMTFHMGGMTNYSIAVGTQTGRPSQFILVFNFFDGSHRGFLDISQFAPAPSAHAPASPLPSAYAAGLCQTHFGKMQ